MGDYVRTYTFIRQVNTKAARSVPFSSFEVSGDTTHDLVHIQKIVYKHYHTSTEKPTWALRGQLVLTDGTAFVSDTVSKKFNADLQLYENTFTNVPTPEQFAKLAYVRTINSAGNYVGSEGYSGELYWRATYYEPMELIVYFSDIPPVQQSTLKSVTSAITVDGSAAIKAEINMVSALAWHTVKWEFGSYSYTTPAFNSASASYAIPLSWLNAIPNAMSGTGKLTLKTYAEQAMTNQIGDAATANFTLKVPTSARPTVAAGWAAASPYNTGQAAGFTTYIQGYSQVKLAFDTSKITTRYGATVKSLKYSVQGAEVTASNRISGVLKLSGSHTIVCTVTDSRGMTNDVSLSAAKLTINVLAYTEPKISNSVLLRSKNNGAPADSVAGDEEGTYLYAKATAQVAGSVGLASLTLSYRERGGSTYTNVSLTSGTGKAVAILATRSYDAVITVTDKLGNSYSVSTIITHKTLTFKMKDGGNALGIGAEPGDDDTLRLGWKLVLEEGLESYVPLTAIGGCVMLASGTDPASVYGGKWTQVSWSGAPSGIVLWRRTA